MDEKKLPQLEDVGMRYQHLASYKDALETCVKILEDRPSLSIPDQRKLAKLLVAVEAIETYITALSDYSDYTKEFALYKSIDGIPSDPAQIPGGRGTPLL